MVCWLFLFGLVLCVLVLFGGLFFVGLRVWGFFETLDQEEEEDR